MTNLIDVNTFILTSATSDDIERIQGAIRQRIAQLREIRAAGVTAGTLVRITDIRPKYLKDLTGTVKSVSGNRCVITLDKASTSLLSFSSGKYFHLTTMETYDLGGVPLSCVAPQE